MLILLRLAYFGRNSIEVEVKSYFRLFCEEILSPFYVFQIAACILWSIDDYVLYAMCILFISLISTVLSLIETKRVNKLCIVILIIYLFYSLFHTSPH